MADELSPRNAIRIEVDRGLCIGSGDCVDTAPGVFGLGRWEQAVVIGAGGAAVERVI